MMLTRSVTLSERGLDSFEKCYVSRFKNFLEDRRPTKQLEVLRDSTRKLTCYETFFRQPHLRPLQLPSLVPNHRSSAVPHTPSEISDRTRCYCVRPRARSRLRVFLLHYYTLYTPAPLRYLRKSLGPPIPPSGYQPYLRSTRSLSLWVYDAIPTCSNNDAASKAS
jgi:hypothetical protein